MSRTHGGALRVLFAACIAILAGALALPSLASAYPPPGNPFVFNQPFVRQSAPEVVVYDWSASKCEDNDITDEATRAFKDDTGQVQLMDTHWVNYRWISSSLTGTYTHPCTKTMSSHNNATYSTFDALEWLASPWTPDGKTIYALLHDEYRGSNYLTGCPSYGACWWNSLSLAVSTNSGATFTHVAQPAHLVAAVPYQYTKNGPHGYFTPSNIVRTGDGYFYTMFRAQPNQAQQLGTCIMRTRDISDPTSWRGWNGTTFSVQFVNPYIVTTNPASHVCAPVDFMSIGTISESLTYNTYFKKWMLVGQSVGDPAFNKPPGIYYALSDDLLNWTDVALLMEAEITYVQNCTPPDPIKEGSILDPNSPGRNFETVGQTGQLFYTLYHLSGCNGTLDRDLVRIPIEFSNQQPAGPSAAIGPSERTASVGEPVTFDASKSKDANGTVKKYQWDFDDDGKFDSDTGTDPTTEHTFDKAKQVTVRLRVTDDDGKFTDDTSVVKVHKGP